MSVFSTQLCGHLCGDVFLLAKPLVHAYYGVAYTPVVDTIPKSAFIVITQWHSLGCEEKTTTNSTGRYLRWGVSVPPCRILHCNGIDDYITKNFPYKREHWSGPDSLKTSRTGSGL